MSDLACRGATARILRGRFLDDAAGVRDNVAERRESRTPSPETEADLPMLRPFAIAAALLIPAATQAADTVRFATFNASLNRDKAGDLVRDLSTPDNIQAGNVAEIIQRVRPDVLLINEFDYDPEGKAVELFRKNYLKVGRNGTEPIEVIVVELQKH